MVAIRTGRGSTFISTLKKMLLSSYMSIYYASLRESFGRDVMLLVQERLAGTHSGCQTSAEQRHRSILLDLCREKAEVWPKKAEVCEGAGEGVEGFLAVLLKDLQCYCWPSMPMDSIGYDQNTSVTAEVYWITPGKRRLRRPYPSCDSTATLQSRWRHLGSNRPW
jgi:hypothetical protein